MTRPGRSARLSRLIARSALLALAAAFIGATFFAPAAEAREKTPQEIALEDCDINLNVCLHIGCKGMTHWLLEKCREECSADFDACVGKIKWLKLFERNSTVRPLSTPGTNPGIAP